MELSSRAMTAVERALDGLTARHVALSANIANSNTPSYVAQAVDFEESLLQALSDGAPPGGVAGDAGFADDFSTTGEVDGLMVGPRVGSTSVTALQKDPLLSWMPSASRISGAQRLDGNGVPVELQMGQLAMNAGKYNALLAIVGKDFQLLKTVAQAK